MKLSAFEKFAMRSWPRAWVMRQVDAPMLFRGVKPGQFPRVLEIGCGTGVGTREILQRLQPGELIATDLDPDMLAGARSRLRREPDAQRVSFQVADATRLPYAEGEFDAVVAFAVLHHIPEYRQVVAEIVRILKPGGAFLLEEVTEAVHFWPINRLMVPAVLFRDRDVLDVLQESGFEVEWKGRYLKAYLFLECRKPTAVAELGQSVRGSAAAIRRWSR